MMKPVTQHSAQAKPRPGLRVGLGRPRAGRPAMRRDIPTGERKMQLGMIGLGRMGGNIVRRLLRHGHSAVVYDVSRDAVAALAAEGATPGESVPDLVARLDPPRAAWVMLPAGPITEEAVTTLGA